MHSLLNHDRPELRRALEELASVRAQLARLAFAIPVTAQRGIRRAQLGMLQEQGELGGLACSPNRRRSNERTVPASRPARNCSGIARGGGPGRPHRIRTLQSARERKGEDAGRAPDSRVRRAPRPAGRLRRTGGLPAYPQRDRDMAKRRFSPTKQMLSAGRRSRSVGWSGSRSGLTWPTSANCLWRLTAR